MISFAKADCLGNWRKDGNRSAAGGNYLLSRQARRLNRSRDAIRGICTHIYICTYAGGQGQRERERESRRTDVILALAFSFISAGSIHARINDRGRESKRIHGLRTGRATYRIEMPKKLWPSGGKRARTAERTLRHLYVFPGRSMKTKLEDRERLLIESEAPEVFAFLGTIEECPNERRPTKMLA